MLIAPLPLVGRFVASNLTAAARDGTVVTTHATTAHTKGSWVSLIDPTPFPIHLLVVQVHSVAGSNVNTSYLLDIALADTGGGNEQILVPDLNVDAASGSSGKSYRFPVSLPAGVRIAARGQSVIVEDAATVRLWLYRQHPTQCLRCGPVVAYGVDAANSRGTSHGEGSGAYGSWVSLGTTTRHHRLWTVGRDQLGDQTMTAGGATLEVGVGPDSDNVTMIARFQDYLTGNEEISGPQPDLVYAPLPSGSALWARSQGNTTENRGVVAYGM